MNILSLYFFCFFIQVVHANYSHRNCTQDARKEWLCDYMRVHDKIYKSPAELELRKTVLARVSKKALLSHSNQLRFGLTSRSDRFSHELQRNLPLKLRHHKKIQRPAEHKHVHLDRSYRLPPIDWRQHNGKSYVTAIEDQGECGDCFAFSSATVLEYWSKKHGHPKSLSAQSIMDCTSGQNRPDVGCEGGLMEYVFEYAKEHPIALETEFPYREQEGTCPQKLLSHVQVQNYKVLMIEDNPKAEQQFEDILHNYGPIGIGIDSENMDNYKGGIFTADQCGKDIDHAVTIIGYTEDAWIIKNSWGPRWGNNGYLYLERGSNACGVAEYGVYVSSAKPINQIMDTNWHMEAI